MRSGKSSSTSGVSGPETHKSVRQAIGAAGSSLQAEDSVRRGLAPKS